MNKGMEFYGEGEGVNLVARVFPSLRSLPPDLRSFASAFSSLGNVSSYCLIVSVFLHCEIDQKQKFYAVYGCVFKTESSSATRVTASDITKTENKVFHNPSNSNTCARSLLQGGES